MRWTNQHNLPESLASAIRNDRYRRVGDISVTGLIRPPRMRVLEKVHADEVTEDVADHVWRLLGQSVHSVLERANTHDHLAEERLGAEVLGWTVTGQPDLLGPDGCLTDFKVTSVFSFLLGEKPECEAQLNMYAWLYRRSGFEVKKAQIVAILRDWTSSRANEEGYPRCGVMVADIPLWEDERAEMFIKQRVLIHQNAEKRWPADPPKCTPEERWARPDRWAVKKLGHKRAVRVFDSESEARAMESLNLEVEFRPGESVRCARFCVVNRWCSQFLAAKEAA